MLSEALLHSSDLTTEAARKFSGKIRITTNLCSDFLIKVKSNKLVGIDQIPEKGIEPEQEKIFLEQEEKKIIQEILREMGEPCEQILTLYLFEGLDSKEIFPPFRLLWNMRTGR
jgi:DNA-directed RNA polymerase specialized sigma subunit